MLEHLPDPSAKGGGLRPPPQRGRGAFGRPPPLWNPLWMGLAGVQASSSKQQASIRHQAASIKHQAARNWAQAWRLVQLGLSASVYPNCGFIVPWPILVAQALRSVDFRLPPLSDHYPIISKPLLMHRCALRAFGAFCQPLSKLWIYCALSNF